MAREVDMLLKVRQSNIKQSFFCTQLAQDSLLKTHSVNIFRLRSVSLEVGVWGWLPVEFPGGAAIKSYDSLQSNLLLAFYVVFEAGKLAHQGMWSLSRLEDSGLCVCVLPSTDAPSSKVMSLLTQELFSHPATGFAVLNHIVSLLHSRLLSEKVAYLLAANVLNKMNVFAASMNRDCDLLFFL